VAFEKQKKLLCSTVPVKLTGILQIAQGMYEGRSINKYQNGAISLILKLRKEFVDDDVIIVTSSVHRTQSVCVLFSLPVIYYNSQLINSMGTR